MHSHAEKGHAIRAGVAGEAIPLGARLFAVIDTLDAITSARPYRRALPFDAAKTEIPRFAGTHLDSAAVEVFSAEERVLREMVALKCSAESTGAPYESFRDGRGNSVGLGRS